MLMLRLPVAESAARSFEITNLFIGDVIMYGDYFLYNWCTSEGKGSGGSGGGGGGGVDDGGCGIMIVIIFVALLLSSQCNNSRIHEHYLSPSNHQPEAIEGVDRVEGKPKRGDVGIAGASLTYQGIRKRVRE